VTQSLRPRKNGGLGGAIGRHPSICPSTSANGGYRRPQSRLGTAGAGALPHRPLDVLKSASPKSGDRCQILGAECGRLVDSSQAVLCGRPGIAVVLVKAAGSCPTAWCRSGGVAAVIFGQGRIDHAAMGGNVTSGSSLNWATLSSVM
jgi:hypothetical protein